MDDGKGRFDNPEELKKILGDKSLKETQHLFAVGEELEIKGSKFVVKEIWPRTLKLKLLPRNK
jgi:hypothetical protein